MLIRNKVNVGLWHCRDLFCVIWHFTGVNKLALHLFSTVCKWKTYYIPEWIHQTRFSNFRQWQSTVSDHSLIVINIKKYKQLRQCDVFIQYYVAQISSSSLCLRCCTQNTVSSAWNRVLVDAHCLSSTSISIANERPFTHSATAHCSFILMKQDTNTLSLKTKQKPTQRSIWNHLFLPPCISQTLIP